MSAGAPEQVLRYAAPSALVTNDATQRLRLTAADGTPAVLFDGRLSRPQVAARMLGAVSLVVTSRFHVPGSMLVTVLDPVVTVGRDDLRFEGFSACAGVHALAVLGPGSHDAEQRSVGTTNVDFGDAMRGALAGVRDGDELQLRIGADAVTVETDASRVVERRVPLPERWVRSFLEVQAIQAALPFAFEVSGAAAARLFRSLVRQGASGRESWIVRSGDALRIAARPGGECVRIAGARRMRVLEHLAYDAVRARFHGSPDAPALGVVLDLGDRWFVLTLGAEVWRGFSGEGTTLEDLADDDGQDALDTRVLAALRFGESVDADDAAKQLGCAVADVHGALARLGRTGEVGFDLARGRHYRRELPFDLARVARLQPRLTKAQALAANGAVTRRDGAPEVFDVRGSGVDHRVEIGGDGAFRCTCRWHARHRGERGPCAHVLAARLAVEGS